MIFEYQSRWICAIENGQADLPSPDEMRSDIEAKKQYIRKYFKDSPRHTIEEESLLYLQDLDRRLKVASKRPVAFN
jgi:hypothetical protein